MFPVIGAVKFIVIHIFIFPKLQGYHFKDFFSNSCCRVARLLAAMTVVVPEKNMSYFLECKKYLKVNLFVDFSIIFWFIKQFMFKFYSGKMERK